MVNKFFYETQINLFKFHSKPYWNNVNLDGSPIPCLWNSKLIKRVCFTPLTQSWSDLLFTSHKTYFYKAAKINPFWLLCIEGLWRNGSASDSRSEGWAFESLWPHLQFIHFSHTLCFSQTLFHQKWSLVSKASTNFWSTGANNAGAIHDLSFLRGSS